jgi:hypothetical protein
MIERRRGENIYPYGHLIEWRRVDGKVRQKVVEYLGPFPDRLGAELTARLRGSCVGLTAAVHGGLWRRPTAEGL